MFTSDFRVEWNIQDGNREVQGTQIIEVPDYVYDEDADRDREMDDDLSPLTVYLAEHLHEIVGNNAEILCYETVD